MTPSPDLDQLVEESRLFDQQLASLPPMPYDTLEGIQQLRALLSAPDSPFVAIAPKPVLPVGRMAIPGPAGAIPAHVIRAEAPAAVYLDIHGGAWMIGGPGMNDAGNDEMARSCGVTTVSIDYRLAPEHALAEAIEDCVAAAAWLVDNAEAELGSGRLLIGGGSAGAQLAVLTLLRMRERGVVGRFAGANLAYGCFDLSGTPSARLSGGSTMLPATAFDAVGRFVLRGLGPEAARDPGISPLYADLAGLPPALFTVGDADPLLDDSLFMSARWRAAGNRADLAVYPAADHAFTIFPTGMARAAMQRQREWVSGLIARAAAAA